MPSPDPPDGSGRAGARRARVTGRAWAVLLTLAAVGLAITLLASPDSCGGPGLSDAAGPAGFADLPREQRQTALWRQADRRPDLLRLHGRGLARELWRAPDSAADPLAATLGPTLSDAAGEEGERGAFLVLLGAGEEVAALASGFDASRLERGVGDLPPDHRSPVRLGIALALDDPEGGATADQRAASCAAVGLRAVEEQVARPVPPGCDRRTVAAGAGLGLAWRLKPSTWTGPPPTDRVPIDDLDTTTLDCAWRSARSELLVLRRSEAARSAAGPPDFGLACSGEPTFAPAGPRPPHPLCGPLRQDARAALVADLSDRPTASLLTVLLAPTCGPQGQVAGARIASERRDPALAGTMFEALLRAELGELAPGPDVRYRLLRGLSRIPWDELAPQLRALDLSWLVDASGRRLEREWLRPLGDSGSWPLPESVRRSAEAEVRRWQERLLLGGPEALAALHPGGEPSSRALLRRLDALHLAGRVRSGDSRQARVALEAARQLGLGGEPWRALDDRLAVERDPELAALLELRPEAPDGDWLTGAFAHAGLDPAPVAGPAAGERLARPRTARRPGVHHLGLAACALLAALWLLANRRWPRRRRLWFRLGAVALPVAALVALECLLALAGAPPPASRRASLTLTGPDAPTTVVERRVIDGQPHGLLVGGDVRAGAFVAARRPGTWRVIALGGSSVYGAGYLREDAFPAVLERRLRALHPEREPEVINAGMGGATSDLVLRFTADVLEYDPDLLVFYLGNNDLEPLAALLDRRLVSDRSLAARILLGRLRIAPLVERLLPDRLLDRARSPGVDPAFLDDRPASTPDRRRALRLLEWQASSNLGAAARLARGRGAEVVVAVQGQAEAACGPDRDPSDDVCHREALRRIALRAGRSSGAAVVDAAGAVEAFRAAAAPPPDDWALYWDAVHPTRLGHAVIGEALAPTAARLLRQRDDDDR